MSIKEEYQNLVDIIDSAPKNSGIQSAAVLAAILSFFEKLQSQIPESGPEDRKSFRVMLDSLQEKLQKVVSFIGQETGMSGEQMAQYGANPSNFTPETWQELQEAEARLGASSRRLVQAIEAQLSEKKKSGAEGSLDKRGAASQGKKPLKGGVKKARVPKARWDKM